jgi:hypothetical protein
MAGEIWNHKRVIDAIRERQGSLTTTWRDDVRLYSIAIRTFGSWNKALVAAGLEPTPPLWTPQRVIDVIRERSRKGLPLHGISLTEPSLYKAAFRHIGSWTKALAAAAVSTTAYHKWTPETVVAAIRTYEQQGVSMAKVYRKDTRLYAAAQKYFGTWKEALSASGITPPPTQQWPKQRVIDAIQTRHRQGLTMTNLIQRDGSLYHAACRRFGSWRNALRAAGLEPKPIRKWTKERVIKELRAVHRLPTTNIRKVDMGLVGAVEKYFGGLGNARRAAGLERPPRVWSPKRVIEAIQDRHVRGVPIQHANWKGDRPLAQAAKRYFGNWYNALVAAGLGHLGTPRRTWTAEKVLRAIQDRHDRGLPIHRVNRHDGSLFYAAEKYFGCWSKALVAAGLNSARRRSWNPDRVLEAIRSRKRRGLPIRNVGVHDAGLARAARRHFGTWRAALDATDGKDR